LQYFRRIYRSILYWYILLSVIHRFRKQCIFDS